jgi:hypothetical protein
MGKLGTENGTATGLVYTEDVLLAFERFPEAHEGQTVRHPLYVYGNDIGGHVYRALEGPAVLSL